MVRSIISLVIVAWVQMITDLTDDNWSFTSSSCGSFWITCIFTVLVISQFIFHYFLGFLNVTPCCHNGSDD